jgi:DNA-binding XRE family transcriptional regulator
LNSSIEYFFIFAVDNQLLVVYNQDNQRLIVRRIVMHGTTLCCLRKAAGLSRKRLAEIVGVSQQFIYQLEKGEKAPRLDTAKRIADALGCTVDDLLKTDDPS